MLNRLLGIATLAALIVIPRPSAAQFAASQDSTLAGIGTVYVNFQMTDGALSSAVVSQLSTAINLELRKTGIKIAPSPTSLDMTKDAVINVGFIKVAHSLSSDLSLRIDVEQMATLQRTGKTTQMVTWYHEETQRNVVPDAAATGLMKQGLDRFLGAWLTANGR